MELTAAAHLVAGGKRGDVHMAEGELKGLQGEISEHFTSDEWRMIGEQAEEIYQGFAERRNHFSL